MLARCCKQVAYSLASGLYWLERYQRPRSRSCKRANDLSLKKIGGKRGLTPAIQYPAKVPLGVLTRLRFRFRTPTAWRRPKTLFSFVVSRFERTGLKSSIPALRMS